MYRIVSYRIVSYYIVSYCIVSYYIALYLVVSYCIVLYCIVFSCIVSYCIVSYCIVSYYIVLYCIVVYCIVFSCIVSYCIELNHIISCRIVEFLLFTRLKYTYFFKNRTLLLNCYIYQAMLTWTRYTVARFRKWKSIRDWSSILVLKYLKQYVEVTVCELVSALYGSRKYIYYNQNSLQQQESALNANVLFRCYSI